MLKLLLDEHISPAVAAGLRKRVRSQSIVSLQEWDDGALLGQDDSVCLETAAASGLTFVTYDRRTIPLLLKDWAEQGLHHGGVIFVDERTIAQSNVGALVNALHDLVQKAGRWDWKDRIQFLRR